MKTGGLGAVVRVPNVSDWSAPAANERRPGTGCEAGSGSARGTGRRRSNQLATGKEGGRVMGYGVLFTQRTLLTNKNLFGSHTDISVRLIWF